MDYNTLRVYIMQEQEEVNDFLCSGDSIAARDK